MTEYIGTRATLLDLLPPTLVTKPTWIDMFDVFARVMDTNVEGPILQIETLRTINVFTDTGVLNSTARLLGFDLSQDVLDLNSDNLTKIVSQLSLYPDQNGTELFIKFIDLVLNSFTKIDYLWTKNYIEFFAQPQGRLLIDGGEWYKTTHVRIAVALLSRDTLVLAEETTLYERTKELFYNFCPAALVIDTLDFVALFDEGDWVNGSFALGAGFAFAEADIIFI